MKEKVPKINLQISKKKKCFSRLWEADLYFRDSTFHSIDWKRA